MAPGCAGMEITVTAIVWAMEEPHTLLAVTLMVPLLGLAVARMDEVVDIPPVQPDGRFQV